jgi:hypothetical protein
MYRWCTLISVPSSGIWYKGKDGRRSGGLSYIWREGGSYGTYINLLVKKKKHIEDGTHDQRAITWGLAVTEERRGAVQVVSSYDWKEGGRYRLGKFVSKEKKKTKKTYRTRHADHACRRVGFGWYREEEGHSSGGVVVRLEGGRQWRNKLVSKEKKTKKNIPNTARAISVPSTGVWLIQRRGGV